MIHFLACIVRIPVRNSMSIHTALNTFTDATPYYFHTLAKRLCSVWNQNIHLSSSAWVHHYRVHHLATHYPTSNHLTVPPPQHPLTPTLDTLYRM